ncbi:hypothetical protein [Ferrimonas marina]|uniref:PilZ domain-containing protein n=1 Tax=Ferrimonas marina TaxID=299255 RepID=A0A1M5YQG8_9GAMM|nr:hypothetical protein [Ferrimonas marina]SHI14306.1 hypothetical protein SAMN02745129_4301 [Ferrimonas marina]
MAQSDDAFFSVASQFEVLLDPIEPDRLWLEPEALRASMPSAFQLMSQVSDLEQHCLPLLKGLEQHAQGLAEYLTLQSQKIDLVLQHQLAQDPNARWRAQGLRFGGSGVSVVVPEPLPQGTALAMRLFLPKEQVAAYAHGEVQQCSPNELGMVAEIHFSAILEADQERLVRASLLVQQRHLRQRAQQRAGS